MKLQVIVLGIFAALTASATPLGVASDYNVFVLGDRTVPPDATKYDHIQMSTDAEGRVAVAGNAYYSSYSAGSALTLDPNRYDLVVGGNLYFHSGSVSHGSIWVGGKTDTANLGLASGGKITKGGTPLLDFAAASQYLNAASKLWSAIPTTAGATVDTQWGRIWLTGTNPTLNVFNLKSVSSNNFRIVAPAGSTVLINVDSVSPSMSNFGFDLQGIDRQHVLFNFHNATTLSTTNVSVQGSILAPKAVFTGTWGNIEGNLIVKTLKGSTEMHNYVFRGILPDVPVPTPEPSSTVLLTTGLCAVLFHIRKRSK